MKYNQEVIVEKNITLSFEFERYVTEHPEILGQIPKAPRWSFCQRMIQNCTA